MKGIPIEDMALVCCTKITTNRTFLDKSAALLVLANDVRSCSSLPGYFTDVPFHAGSLCNLERRVTCVFGAPRRGVTHFGAKLLVSISKLGRCVEVSCGRIARLRKFPVRGGVRVLTVANWRAPAGRISQRIENRLHR